MLRTGLGFKVVNATKKQRRFTNIQKINDPGLKFQLGSGYRASKVGTKPPFDLEAIRNGYLVESYIRQSTDKYVEIVLKEGWKFIGKPGPINYIKKRLDVMTIMSGQPWELVIETAARDYIKYGNCFLVQQRTQRVDPVPGLSLNPISGKTPIGAYFNLPVHQMTPELDENGKTISWIQKNRKDQKFFNPTDILHFTYCKEPGGIWGQPPVLAVIDDLRAYRQAEENIFKLIYKNLNPLIHHTIPDITGTGEGRQEDVEDAIRNFQSMAPDGYIVTPPGVTIKTIGAESHALRAEGYMSLFKKRVFSGLGISELVMGENEGANAGSADALSLQMYHRSKMYQYLLSKYFTIFILYELLVEGGYDPWNNEDDQVTWGWNPVDIDRHLKEQTHALNLWTMNSISMEELREKLGMNKEFDIKSFYAHVVQIPQVIASKIGMDPIDLDSEELKDTQNKSSGNIPKQNKSVEPNKNQYSQEDICSNILKDLDLIKDIRYENFISKYFNNNLIKYPESFIKKIHYVVTHPFEGHYIFINAIFLSEKYVLNIR